MSAFILGQLQDVTEDIEHIRFQWPDKPGDRDEVNALVSAVLALEDAVAELTAKLEDWE